MAASSSPRRLVRDLAGFIRRYVVMSDDKLLIVALWVIHTHCARQIAQTPYLAVTSPEKQCGKSRLLETLELLAADAWLTILPSEAVVYRQVDARMPTLMLDEADTIFNPRSADRYEGLRALLNNGHRQGAKVPRCVGSTNKVVEFSTFCPKVLAGIGTLPDTVADRSIPIRLERRTRGEPVERFRRRDAEPEATALTERIQAWAARSAAGALEAPPAMPEELSDRMQEGCECLVAIADALGCGRHARAALVALLTAERLDDQESMRLRLLADLRAVFDARDAERGKRTRSIPTSQILRALWDMKESPWGTYYGRQLDDRDLAALLRHYGVKPVPIKTASGKVLRGYRRDALHEAWKRYL